MMRFPPRAVNGSSPAIPIFAARARSAHAARFGGLTPFDFADANASPKLRSIRIPPAVERGSSLDASGSQAGRKMFLNQHEQDNDGDCGQQCRGEKILPLNHIEG